MCGLAGIVALSAERRVVADELHAMASQLVHRGPDDAGVYVDPRGRCGFGFRRLSIIDVAGGRQPIANEDGTVWCVLNGEIYNFSELRAELRRDRRGPSAPDAPPGAPRAGWRREGAPEAHRFRTGADSEVVVHLYEEHGPACFERLAGMFAIALWDERRGVLHLARDRLGKKPLVYLVHDGRLLFASELKAILALPGVPRRIDPQSLHRYLLFQYVPAPHCLLAGFAKLPPGHRLEAAAAGAAPAGAVAPIRHSERSEESGHVAQDASEPSDQMPRSARNAAADSHAADSNAAGSHAERPREPALAVDGAVRPLVRVEAYWRPPAAPAGFAGSYEDARERLGDLLTQAVRRRLVSDVPLGAFLSGGVDSSIIVALMHRLGVSPLRTFSIGFEQADYDESRYARLVARHFGTEHHEFVVAPDAREAPGAREALGARDVLDALAFHYDEPLGDSSAIPTYHVSRCTRQSVTVALTGDGGDECFAGYDRYWALGVSGALDFLPLGVRAGMAWIGRRLPRAGSRSLSRRAFRLLAALPEPPWRRYLAWMNVLTPAMLEAGYRDAMRSAIDFEEPLRWFESLFHAHAGAAAERASYSDLLSYLPGDLLAKVDIASMACGLECRAPFLDHELVEFALSLPIEWRMGKRILKDWARPLVPREILERPKMGFGVPVAGWFRAELRDALREMITARDSICAAVFRPGFAERLHDEHLARREDHGHALWTLFMLERWRRRWGAQF